MQRHRHRRRRAAGGAAAANRPHPATELNKAATRYEAGEIDDEQFAIVSKTLRQRDNEITAT